MILRGPLVNHDFGLLWVARTVSTLGDWIFLTSVTLWIATDIARDQQWAPLAVGGLDVTVALVTVAFGPVAGVFIDRWPKRRTMLAADAVRCALMCALLPLPLVGAAVPVWLRLGALFVAVGATAICTALFNPAQLAMMGDVVEDGQRARAASALQVGFSAALIVGPALGAPLYFALGVDSALTLNALSYLASFVAVRAIRHRAPLGAAPSGPAGVGGQLLSGIGFVARHPTLRTLLGTTFVVGCGAGALNALGIFFVVDNLHAPAAWYGLYYTSLAAGVLASAFAVGWLGTRFGPVRLYRGSLLGAGLLILLLSRQTAFAPAAAVIFLIGIANAGLNVATVPILLSSTPPGMVGRVGALLNPLASGAQLGSVALASYLASTALHGLHAHFLGGELGTFDAIFGGAGILVTIAALCALVALPAGAPETSERVAEPAST